MKERPILFSAPMVRALLNGTKTQTRRVVKKSEQWPFSAVKAVMLETRSTAMAVDAQRCAYGPEIKCPHGQPGDRLWVRETWIDASSSLHTCVIYRADGEDQACGQPWKPSIFMPRWASRITLEITAVRVERLLRISESDAKAEGAQLSEGPCTEPEFQSYTLGYLNLWNSINGPDSWNKNPWVWVIEFKKVTP